MTLPFPVQEDSYGKTLTIILTPIELKNGNTVTLWTEEKSVEGTETQYAGEVINKTIVYRERVSDRLSTVSIFILIILIVSLLYELTQRIQNKKIFSTCLNGKNVRWIYRCAESACPVFWKSSVQKEEITVPDR